jgi:hypothetical protein
LNQQMVNRADRIRVGRENSEGGHSIGPWLPRPTMQFRLRAWQAFQRLLDPFAPPKPLRRPHKH